MGKKLWKNRVNLLIRKKMPGPVPLKNLKNSLQRNENKKKNAGGGTRTRTEETSEGF